MNEPSTMRAHPCPSPSPLPRGRRLRGFAFGHRSLARAARRSLFAALAPRWRGTRESLRRAVRSALKLGRGSPAFFARLARDARFASLVAGAFLSAFVGPSFVSPPIELSDIVAGAGGFAINGIDVFDRSGFSVSSAGDVNGDGLADVIVGAEYADPGGDSAAGESYVVFGKADGTAVDLSAVAAGAGGFAINGIDAFDRSGSSVSSAGDVNGDGLTDLIVGAWSADPGGQYAAGESCVVFGKADGTAVELSDVAGGAGGFAINGIDEFDRSGYSVSSAGDVNGEGLAALLSPAP